MFSTGSASVTTGHGTVSLTGKVLPSEPYAFPVPATSTGDGSTTTVNGTVVTSETALNPETAGSAASGSRPRLRRPHPAVDGTGRRGEPQRASRPGRCRVVQDRRHPPVRGPAGIRDRQECQLALPGDRRAAVRQPPEMVFTITSATINPSAAYTRLGSGRITTVAAGTDPHVSFSDAPPFNSPRWGDYSFAQPDPDGYGVWLATEYIPPAADQDPMDNWGTCQR